MKKTILTLSFLVGSYVLFAQGTLVKRIVTSKDDGQPISGVAVVAKGTTIGIVIDFNGKMQMAIRP